MDRNIRIAKSLVRIAMELVGRARFTDGLGEDSDNTNAKYDAQYERIVRELYPNNVAETIIMCGHGLDYHMPIKGTMGNGNIVLKYNADPRMKELIIQALVSEKHRITPADTRDIINLYKFLKKQVDDGYAIETDCNTHSIPFLSTFAKKNNYHFHAGPARMEFGDTGDEGDLSRMCICCRRDDPRAHGIDNADRFTRERPNLDRMVDNQK